MSSTDFAAAQQRILARRAARETAAATTTSPALPPALLNLPPALRYAAQSSIRAWDIVRSPYGTRPAFRVGQVDAELLDEELLQLLRGQVGDALKYFGGHLGDDWGEEIGAALRLALWKLSIWDRGTSYGASLQGLRYVDARGRQEEDTGSRVLRVDPTAWQKAAYGLLTVGGRYGWRKWEDWLVEREGGYEEPSPLVQRFSRITAWLGTTHEVAALASFLVFLYNGRYRTLIDRLLGLRLAPTSNQTSREVSFEYLNRQLVWHAFTEFLLFLLPLVGISRWKRWLSRAWRKVTNMVKRKSDVQEEDTGRGELGFLPERTCAICYKDQTPTSGASEADVLAASGTSGGVIGSAQTDVTNPYEALPCGCIYCFVCIAQRIEAEEGEGWVCLRCGEIIKNCKPWSGGVVEEVDSRMTPDSRSGSRKSVVFADDEDEEDNEEHESDNMVSVDPIPVPDDEGFVEGEDSLANSMEEQDSQPDDELEWAGAEDAAESYDAADD